MFLSLCSYISVTVSGVQVTEGKAKELNFTLAPVLSEAAGSTTAATTSVLSINHPNNSTTSSSDSTQTVAVPTVSPTSHQPVQPQEFRHHNYADMELFLRKYSSEFPSITHLHSVGHSVDGRELYVMVISDNPEAHEHGML